MSRRTELRQLLESHTASDAREAEHRARILELLAAERDPFDRAQYSPGHITASAFVLDASRRAVLLILHGKLDRWLQPGGHVDPDDRDVLQAARREVREEVGLRDIVPARHGLLDLDVHAIPARGDQPAHEHFDVRFLFVAPSQQVTAGSDARAARWVPIAQLLDPAAHGGELLRSDESVLRALRKIAGGA